MIPRTVRLKLNYNLTPGDNDETLIEAWKGDALRVQFGIFDNSLPVADISDISSVNMFIMPSQTNATPLAESVVANASMITIPNVARWNSGAMQNGTIEFTADQMNLTVTGVDDDFWWVITATNSDGQCTLGCGTFRMINQNSDTVGSPPTNPAAGITQTAADARYLLAGSGIIPDARMPNLTGDVTTSEGAVATTIADGVVTYAKMQDVSDTDKILGRSSSGSGDVEEIACTAAGRALLDDANAATQRTTLGLGNAALATTSQGGNGAADSGKVARYQSDGSLAASVHFELDDGTSYAELAYNQIQLFPSLSGGWILIGDVLPGSTYTITIPKESGTMLTSTSSINATKIQASGLPTSPGASGTLWNDGGTVKIA